MKKIKDFVTYLNAQVKNNSLYLWGGQGENVLSYTPAKIVSRETSRANAGRVLITLGNKIKSGADMSQARYFDCSGLGVFWFMENELLNYDTTAQGLYNLCAPIELEKVKTGDMVFKKDSAGKVTHVGYVVDKNKSVIEAYGRDVGVIKKKLGEGSNFNCAGRPKFKWE